jgi:hypothetical protein
MEHHGRELEAALAALADPTADAPGAALRALAPELDLAALTTP